MSKNSLLKSSDQLSILEMPAVTDACGFSDTCGWLFFNLVLAKQKGGHGKPLLLQVYKLIRTIFTDPG